MAFYSSFRHLKPFISISNDFTGEKDELVNKNPKKHELISKFLKESVNNNTLEEI